MDSLEEILPMQFSVCFKCRLPTFHLHGSLSCLFFHSQRGGGDEQEVEVRQ